MTKYQVQLVSAVGVAVVDEWYTEAVAKEHAKRMRKDAEKRGFRVAVKAV